MVGSASGCGSAGRVRPATAAPRSGEARRGGGRPRNTHAVVAELVQLKQQQSALTKQVDVVVRDQIKAHRAELNQLLDSLPRKANDNVVWKAMETKATVKYVDKLYEQSLRYTNKMFHKSSLEYSSSDEMQRAFKAKADIEVVKALALDVSKIKTNVDKYINDAITTLTLGTRDRLRNVATKLELKKELSTKCDVQHVQQLGKRLVSLEKVCDVVGGGGGRGGGGGGRRNGDMSFEDIHGLNGGGESDQSGESALDRTSAFRLGQVENVLNTLQDQMRSSRSLFENSIKSTENMLDRLQKDKDVQNEVLKAHVTLRVRMDEQKKSQGEIRKAVAGLQAQIHAIHEHMKEAEEANARKDEKRAQVIEQLRQEIVVIKFRLKDNMDLLSTNIRHGVHSWRERSHHGGHGNDGEGKDEGCVPGWKTTSHPPGAAARRSQARAVEGTSRNSKLVENLENHDSHSTMFDVAKRLSNVEVRAGMKTVGSRKRTWNFQV